MRIVITGAAGRIGRVVLDELVGHHDLVLLDRTRCRAGVLHGSMKKIPYYLADLADAPRPSHDDVFDWERALVGADTILHLAGDPSPQATPESATRNNVVATQNLLEGAARQGVRNVVFASSHWVFHEDTRRVEAAWGADPRLIDPSVDACPDTAYGRSKAAAEDLGCAAVAAGRLDSFVGVRIGSVGWRPCNPSTNWAGKHLVVGVADLRMILRLCLERPIRGYHLLGAGSPGPDAALDLSETWRLLDWSPPEVHALRPVA